MVVFYTCKNKSIHIYFLFYFKLHRIKTSFQSIGEYCHMFPILNVRSSIALLFDVKIFFHNDNTNMEYLRLIS